MSCFSYDLFLPNTATCASDEFTCEAEGTCIDNTQLCDFIPDCRVSQADETEDLCKVSSLTVEQVVSLRRNNTWTTPATYPTRDGTVETPLDYILYQLSVTGSSATTSHILINLVFVEFAGNDSSILIGRGHDPVQALYDNDGPLLSVENGIWRNAVLSITTPDNEAYILLRKAPGDNVEINIELSAFQCLPEGAIACKRSAECYLESEACDDIEQCPGGDDEDGCSTPDECHNCTTAWAENTCLPSYWVCDGTQDCLDNSDENECPTCFECESSYKCVKDPEYVCDGVDDCYNGEDELNCTTTPPSNSSCFECESDFGCVVDPDWVCDRVKDCSKGEDEMNCPATIFPCFECESDFACILDPTWVCDGDDDCYNGEDEFNCTVTPPKNSSCFDCASDYCVIDEWVCDGDDDCFNGEDELNCTAKCFECAADYCVFHEWICDGEDDCYNGEDELNCTGTENCPDASFACPEPDSTCIEETLLCDFIPHCRASGSDETEELCMVSQISEDISVPFNEYRWLITPDAYPSRDINTTKDYLLYRASSPPNSHLLIEIIKVVFDGDDSSLTIGTGHDPVQAFYDDGLLLGFSRYFIWNDTVPFRGSTPGNEAYILLERAPGGNVNMSLRLSAFQCAREDDIPCTYSNDCYQESEICDGVVQCELSQEDETDCITPPTNSPCFDCASRYCVIDEFVCDGDDDCFNGEDELNCTSTPLPCVQCDSDWSCVYDSWICDGVADCYNGEDEADCNDCGEDEYPCFFDDTTCFNASDVCDGIYDCPSGADEFNCTGCLACSDTSDCLIGLQVCNFYNDCPGGEDETEGLCNHSQFIDNIEIKTGEWQLFSEGYVSERILDDRDTPASNIYDFTHYGFNSDPGTTLYIEIQNLTVSLSGSLVPLVRISFGSGADPTDLNATRAYVDGYGNAASISNSLNFSLTNNTGFLLIAIPKTVIGIFNIIFRVTAIECVSPEVACNGSPHCYNLFDDICDEEIQCLDSQEDEYGCEATPPANSTCYDCESSFPCVEDPEWICDGYSDCYNGEDEMNCTVNCFECQTHPFYGNCIGWDSVCDGEIDCFNGTDEVDCDGTPLPCFQCDSDWPCVPEAWVCDGFGDCYNGVDEAGCNDCGEDEYLCFFDDTTCFNASDVCDGIYDCPSGADEFNCTGCLACSNTSTCLIGLQVCNFYNDCPGGEDETEGLCNHSQFIENVDIQTGEWQLFSEGYVSERILDDRDTPASNIYDFTHYGFNSDPGTTLYIEIQNLTVSLDLSGLLLSLVRISFGSGADPTDINATRGYVDGYGNVGSISESMNFSLTNNTGFLLIAIPKTVAGIFNIIFRVTAIECVGPEVACNGSPHCYDWFYDTCDGEIQCLDSGEDEYGCEATPPGNYSCFECESKYECVYDPYWVCDGKSDCNNGEDEMNCTASCFECQTHPDENNCIDFDWVCDKEIDCFDGSDESDCDVSPLPCISCESAYPCVPVSWVCDRDVDCYNGQDELNCDSGNSSCFFCENSGDCVPWDYVCDGDYDCYDTSDEKNCNTTSDPECFPCYSDRCVQLEWVCDGEADCRDGSDERECDSTGLPCFECATDAYQCVHLDYVCDEGTDCDDGSDEWNCTYCFECPSHPDYNNCLKWDFVCDGEIDCFDGTDELDCDASPLPCVQCDSPWPCVPESWVCDGGADCYNGEDEAGCNDCGEDEYPCFFDDTTCFNASDVCDGIYDCPSGADEFNCTGCFACGNTSTCLSDLQVCNFYNDCPGGEDETEGLCNHSQFIKNVDIQTGEWQLFSEGYVSERIIDDRDTPASNIYDFTHYGFNSDPGTTLYMEIQNLTVSLSGLLVPLVQIYAGSGADPTDRGAARGYIDGYGNAASISDSMNFSLTNNTGFLLIAIPKSVAGIFNIIFRVTAIECVSPDVACNGSPHCYNLFDDICDEEIQCVDSGEDEFGCEATPPANSTCYDCESAFLCVKDPEWICDGWSDCDNGEDEMNCPASCFECQTHPSSDNCIDFDSVCDGKIDCFNGTDELDCDGTPLPCVQCDSDWPCVRESWVCDREEDCYNGEDELNCVPGNSSCFFCENSGDCVSWDYVCDGAYDCYDTSDEQNCNTTSDPECFPCWSYFCVELEYVCDGDLDCRDGSDERDCNSTEPICFQCATDVYQCIDLDYVCDEGTDCDDGSDEWNCTSCELNEFRCNRGGECIGSESVCNLAPECTFAEDEMSCGYDDISTEVWVVAGESYDVNTIELQPVGDNIKAALWHFFAPNSSYVLFFDVSSSYALPDDAEAVFGEGTDFLGSRTASYYRWGSITKFSRHDFFVLSHEAFVSVDVPLTESAPVTLSFSVRAVPAPECTGDSSVCVACYSDFETCDRTLECSQSTEYECPSIPAP
ncbi:uncharacterized protein LOC755356 isoform X3 [Strongylocentrotus purpuratus]|uniref:Uncharacterized protein n=1 Tax=Strongylocentrotus purpuratus TaxID=7668 RepID=A0A7M7N9K2_STRPU|nr:uncharacterized protein LOC755356 isoform X3 [Strongylocentrotus purpuratus]